MRRWEIVEWVGAGLLAVALGMWQLPLGIGWCGVYLLASGIMQQVVGQERREEEKHDG